MLCAVDLYPDGVGFTSGCKSIYIPKQIQLHPRCKNECHQEVFEGLLNRKYGLYDLVIQ